MVDACEGVRLTYLRACTLLIDQRLERLAKLFPRSANHSGLFQLIVQLPLALSSLQKPQVPLQSGDLVGGCLLDVCACALNIR